MSSKPFENRSEIFLSLLNKRGQLLQLLYTYGCLHISDLEIVPDMRVNILVIVTCRKRSKMPAESLATAVIAARITPAVPSPVTK